MVEKLEAARAAPCIQILQESVPKTQVLESIDVDDAVCYDVEQPFASKDMMKTRRSFGMRGHFGMLGHTKRI